MTDWLLEEIAAARRERKACALVTVAAAKGSVPREAGAKMLVYADGKISGTIGGGKFESLVIKDAQQQMRAKKPLLKTYPLHEKAADSFGAICGGESTVLIEPQVLREAIFLIGAGHCAQAIAKLALECGLHVTVVDDRKELLSIFPEAVERVDDVDVAKFIGKRKWAHDEAIALVSRNYVIDRVALAAAVKTKGAGYIGMIGSRRKVQRVFDELRKLKIDKERLAKVYAPLGLDIGADSPAEIAVSVLAEILAVLRKHSGRNLRDEK
ncbi:MAG: xanthine dehydrogenase accessory factor [Verrucomicrobiota bacterium]|jgi:xanthine dehydrogenase accessory factor